MTTPVTEKASKNAIVPKVKPRKISRVGIKKHLSDKEIASVFARLKALKNKEHALIFRLVLSTGTKIADAKKVKWRDINCRLATIFIKNRILSIPLGLAKEFESFRDETALGEEQEIFYSIYRENWRALQTVLDQLGIITHSKAWQSVRNSYILKFMQTYGDRKRLQKQLGLTTLRWIPKYLLNVAQKPIDLFELDKPAAQAA